MQHILACTSDGARCSRGRGVFALARPRSLVSGLRLRRVAQQAAPDGNGDPPAPVAPEVVSRSENGRVVVRAVRVVEPLRVDGRLDEAVYQTVPAISDFIQTVPREGELATEKTDAWVLYDDDYMYVVCRCWDSAPPEQWVANEMRRDTNQLRQNDTFGVVFDTFHDRRNGYRLLHEPARRPRRSGAHRRGQPEHRLESRLGRSNRAIRRRRGRSRWPFRSSRCATGQGWRKPGAFSCGAPSGARTSGRISRRSPLRPAVLKASSAISMAGDAGRARSAVGQPQHRDQAVRDRQRRRPIGSAGCRTIPIGTSASTRSTASNANLTADVTVNTDFAQVEVDEQQVNLTRFALIFPEKRDFFLEGRGMFEFGRGGISSSGGGGGAATPRPSRRRSSTAAASA